MTAFFVERPRRLEDLKVLHALEAERSYEIVARLSLSRIDYDNFTSDLLADRPFIAERLALCRAGTGFPCLFVQPQGESEGILLHPMAPNYVRWAAYLSEEP